MYINVFFVSTNHDRKWSFWWCFRNALSMEMMTSLYEDITKDINNKDLRVIILSANGPVFSSGHDLKELVSSLYLFNLKTCDVIEGKH